MASLSSSWSLICEAELPSKPLTAAEAEPQLSEEELERLAIAQVEELVKTEPERVSEILSAWALEDLEQAKAGA